MITEYCVSEVETLPVDELPKDFFEYFSKNYYGFGECYWWVYRDKNKTLIGVCGLDMYEKNAGFLCMSWVNPDFRGQGFQKKMIRIRERKARSIGCKRLVSYTVYDNNPSANNLISCGYKLYTPHFNWGLKAANYWQKNL